MKNMLKGAIQFLGAMFSYIWAICLSFVVILLFFGLDMWSDLAAELPFMSIHPRYKGGSVAFTLEDSEITYRIHNPVFDGLISPRKEGFIQIDIQTLDHGLPVQKEIDFDQDSLTDFRLQIDGSDQGQPQIFSNSSTVIGLGSWARTEEGWIVRVGLLQK